MCDILLVEDDDSIRQMVRDVLDDEGYAVEVAEEGQAALAYLQACNQLPRVILLDLVMPGIDGVQFLELQQKDPRLADVPVILFSAANQLELFARRFRAAYVSKPFDVTILLALVEQFCAAYELNALLQSSHARQESPNLPQLGLNYLVHSEPPRVRSAVGSLV